MAMGLGLGAIGMSWIATQVDSVDRTNVCNFGLGILAGSLILLPPIAAFLVLIGGVWATVYGGLPERICSFP